MAANTLQSFNRLNAIPLDSLQTVTNKSSDVPYSTAYIGQICYETSSSTLFVVTAKSGGTLTWTAIPTGTLTTTFLALTDTPDVYDNAKVMVRVNPTKDALEFFDIRASTSEIATGTEIDKFISPATLKTSNITFSGVISFLASVTASVFVNLTQGLLFSQYTNSSPTIGQLWRNASDRLLFRKTSTNSTILEDGDISASGYIVTNAESSTTNLPNINHKHYFNSGLAYNSVTQSGTTINFNNELQTRTLTQGTNVVIDTFTNLAAGEEVLLEVNCGSTITGTITVSGTAMTGTGTSFTTLGITTGTAGNTITIAGNVYGISSITNNTAIVLLASGTAGTGVNTGITFSNTSVTSGTGTLNNEIVFAGTYNFYQGTVVCGTALAGTISVSGTTMTGVGTTFNTSTTPVNSTIWINNNTYIVSSITSTTVIVLTTSGTSVSNAIGIVLAALDSGISSAVSIRIGNISGTVNGVISGTVSGSTQNYAFTFLPAGNTNIFYNATLTRANNVSFAVSGITTIINSQFISGITNYISIKAYSATKVLINFFTPRSF
jgi:hypothetical protein